MKLTLLVAVIGLLSVVQGQSQTTPTSSKASTPIVTPTPATTTTSTSTKSVVPTPTPSPKPSPCEFIVFYNNTDPKGHNEVCFHMEGCFSLNFTYNVTANKTRTVSLYQLDGTEYNQNKSLCRNDTAYIIFEWTNDTNEFYLNFTFTASLKKGSRNWQYQNLSMNYTIHNNKTFSDFMRNNKLLGAHIKTNASQPLFDETNSIVEFQRPYRCKAEVDIPFKNKFGTDFNETLVVSNLRVQAFQFKNVTSGAFGADRYCVFDSNGGSKIVPIAVGAALGVLVIIILLAYLISQFVTSRKKKASYEPLN